MTDTKENTKGRKLTMTFHARQMAQIERVNELLCHPTLSETIRYLINRGLIEVTTRENLADISRTHERLVKLLENPEFPGLETLLDALENPKPKKRKT